MTVEMLDIMDYASCAMLAIICRLVCCLSYQLSECKVQKS